MADDAVFCSSCGTKTDAGQQVNEGAAQTPSQVYTPPQPAYVPAPPKKSHTGLILGIVGGVVALAAAVVVLLLTGVLGGDADDISDIEGKWYSSDVMVDFDEDGTVHIETKDDEINGEYTYNATEKRGEIESDNEDFDGVSFTLRSDYLKLDGEKYYRDKEEAGYGESNEETGDAQQHDPSSAQQFVGLWQAVEGTYEGQTIDMSAMGMALDFAADGSVTEYEGYEASETGTWEAMEDGTLQLSAADGDVMTLANIVMDEGGAAFTADVTTDGETGSMRLVKTDMAAFAAPGADLLPRLQGFWWICGTTELPPVNDGVLAQGLVVEFSGEIMNFYSDFGVEALDIDYEFIDADTMRYIEDGSEYTVDFGFETIGGTEYMTMTAQGMTTYLMLSSYDAYMASANTPSIPAIPDVDTTYTSDADVRALIAREWNEWYYLGADGTMDEDVEDFNLKIYSDGTFEEIYYDEYGSGQWNVENGVLTLEYNSGEVYSWPAFIEYSTDIYAYLLYFEMNDGVEGTYVVFTDYQP